MGFQILDANQPNDPYMEFLKAVAVGDVSKNYEPIIRTEELKYYEATVIEKLAEENQHLRDTIQHLKMELHQSEEHKNIVNKSKAINKAELFQIRKKLVESEKKVQEYEDGAKVIEENTKLNNHDQNSKITMLQQTVKDLRKRNDKLLSELEASKNMLSANKLEGKKAIDSLQKEFDHQKNRADVAEEKLIRHSLDMALFENFESERSSKEARVKYLEKKIDTMTYKLDRAVEGESYAIGELDKYKSKVKKLEKTIKPLKVELERQQNYIAKMKKFGDSTYSSTEPTSYLATSPVPENENRLKRLKRGSTMSSIQSPKRFLSDSSNRLLNDSPNHNHMAVLDQKNSKKMISNGKLTSIQLGKETTSNSAEASPRRTVAAAGPHPYKKNVKGHFGKVKRQHSFSPSHFKKNRNSLNKKMKLDHVKSRYLNGITKNSSNANPSSTTNNQIQQLSNEKRTTTIRSPITQVKSNHAPSLLD